MVLFHEMGQVFFCYTCTTIMCASSCGEENSRKLIIIWIWLGSDAQLTYCTCTHGTHVTTGNPFSGVKNEFWENKTVKSYFSCLLSSLLGFRVVLEPFQGFFDLLPLTTLKKREGWTVAKHVWFYSVMLTSGKSQSPEILLWQGKVGILHVFHHPITVEVK